MDNPQNGNHDPSSLETSLAPAGRVVTELFAFITTDANNDEGLAYFYNDHERVWVPIVTLYRDEIEILRDAARTIARSAGKELKLCRFSLREDLEVIR